MLGLASQVHNVGPYLKEKRCTLIFFKKINQIICHVCLTRLD
jgi:hypothetical protein